MQPTFAVKIVMTYGHFFVTQPGTEYEAKCFIRDWHSGGLALQGVKRLGDPDKGWSILVDAVVGMHVVRFDPQQPQAQTIPNPYANIARPGSGLFQN